MTTEEWDDIPEWEPDVEWEKQLGKYYGYPECCIEWFINRLGFLFTGEGSGLDENQESLHNSKGFIPCPSCANRIVSEGLNIEVLIKNRLCPQPYPESEYLDMLTYMEQFFPEEVEGLRDGYIESINYRDIYDIEQEIDVQVGEQGSRSS